MVTLGKDNISGVVKVDETYIGCDKPGKRNRGVKGRSFLVVAVEVNDSNIGRIGLNRVMDNSSDF